MPSTLPRANAGVYVHIFYLWSRDTQQTMKTGNMVGRPHGTAALLMGREEGSVKVSLHADITGAMGAVPHSKRRK